MDLLLGEGSDSILRILTEKLLLNFADFTDNNFLLTNEKRNRLAKRLMDTSLQDLIAIYLPLRNFRSTLNELSHFGDHVKAVFFIRNVGVKVAQ